MNWQVLGLGIFVFGAAWYFTEVREDGIIVWSRRAQRLAWRMYFAYYTSRFHAIRASHSVSGHGSDDSHPESGHVPDDSQEPSGQPSHVSERPRGRFRRHGTQVSQSPDDTLILPPDDGRGWQGPVEGSALARYSRTVSMTRAQLWEQQHHAWEHENDDALAEHRAYMQYQADEWAAFLRAHGYPEEAHEED